MKAWSAVILLLFFFDCSGSQAKQDEDPEFSIIRFDNQIYQYLTQNEPNDGLLQNERDFLDEYGEKVIGVGRSDSVGFYERLQAFFSEPTLMGLYQDEQAQFTDISEINNELSQAMEKLFEAFPDLKKPRIYMHFSGLNQNVIVTDEILSLSADKYLGTDYPLYQRFFYDYQRQQMSPDRIVPDYLLGFLMANFPFEGREDVLLDRMLYEGKLRYILSCFLPNRNAWEWVGYNEAQYTWSVENQSKIWKKILENRHLYTPDFIITSQYLNEAPYTAPLTPESPCRIGIWLGFRIISAYMKLHPDVSLPELIEKTDYQELLKLSKFK